MAAMRKFAFIVAALLIVCYFIYWIPNFFSSSFIEENYRNGFFQYLRIAYDYSLGKSPIPFIYILFLFLLAGLVYFIKSLARKDGGRQKFIYFSKAAIYFCFVVFILFYFFWGLNYFAPGLRSKIKLNNISIDSTLVVNEANRVMDKLCTLRDNISNDSLALALEFVPKNLEDNVRVNVESILEQWNIPIKGHPRIRLLSPSGILLRISTAGVYVPFVFEGHIDRGLSVIQWPFTMAHEMCHAYGITDEGECNFVAILACIKSDDAFIRYSGLLAYWRYLANSLRDKTEYSFLVVVSSSTPAISNDIKDIYTHLEVYPDILPGLRDIVYDSYLKANGVSEGMKSYGMVVEMMLQYGGLQLAEQYPLKL